MLETIREYAQRELEREGEGDAAGTRHTAYFADLAVRVDAASTYVMSDEQRDLYLSDRANFNEAHARALATGDGASALRFVRRLGRATQVTGSRARDWYARCAASIALPGGAREDRAWALVRTARIADYHGRVRSGSELARRSRRAVGRARGLARECGCARGAMRRRAIDRQLRSGTRARRTTRRARTGPSRRRSCRCRVGSSSGRSHGRFWDEPSWTTTARLQNVVEALFAASADAAAAGPLYEQAGSLQNLAYCLFVLGDYSDGIATGQRALRKLLEPEATVESQTQLVSECLFSDRDLALRDEAKPTSVSSSSVPCVACTARTAWPSGLSTERSLAVSRRSRGRLWATTGYEAAVRRGEVLTREEAIELALDISANQSLQQ